MAATHVTTGRRVAIKRVQSVYDSHGAVAQAIREVSLNRRATQRSRSSSDWAARLLDALVDDADGSLYLVFERMDGSLAGELSRMNHKREGALDSLQSRKELAHKLLVCVARLHASSIAHRDLKPQNVLVSRSYAHEAAEDASAVSTRVAICDFGMARSTMPVGAKKHTGNEGEHDCWTDYVTTRWYRAPEALCQCRGVADPRAADMWAVGCIIAEILLGRPLFPGRDTRTQLDAIVAGIGPPDDAAADWYTVRARDAAAVAVMVNECDTRKAGITVAFRLSMSRRGDQDAVDLVRRLLDYIPDRRPTAADALKHRMFSMFSTADCDDDDDDDDNSDCAFSEVGAFARGDNDEPLEAHSLAAAKTALQKQVNEVRRRRGSRMTAAKSRAVVKRMAAPCSPTYRPSVKRRLC